MTTLHDVMFFVTRTEQWLSVDELVDRLDAQGAWDEIDLEQALRDWKKIQVRRELNHTKGSDGFPVFANVEVIDPDGTKVRIYKQEALFRRDDYLQVRDYHLAMSEHHRFMAESYTRRAAQKGIQLPLPQLARLSIVR